MIEKLISACYKCGSDLGDYALYGDIEGHIGLASQYCEVCGRDVFPVLMTESEAEMRKNKVPPPVTLGGTDAWD